MAPHSQIGKGKFTIVPPTPKVISGRGLSHRKSDKRQLAVMAANAADGLTVVTLTEKQVADMFGVSVTYVRIARSLSLGKRAAILHGSDQTSFATLMPNGTKSTKKVNTDITDVELIEAVRCVGVTRVLNAAVAVEAAE
jgi:Pyruvate/2-oxoacid:ferredoxin oxidoreductase gamma subunit